MRITKLFTINQVAKSLGANKCNIISYINEKPSNIKAIKIKGRYYFKEEEFRRLVRNRASNIGLKIVIPEGYLTSAEVINRYNITQAILHYSLGITVKKVGKFLFWNEDEVDKWIENRKNVKNEFEVLDNDEKWIKMGSLNKKLRIKVYHAIMDNKLVPNEEVKEVYYGKTKKIYVSKRVVKDILEGLNYEEESYMELACKNIKVNDNYDMREIEKAVNLLMKQKFDYKGIRRFKISEIESIININRDEIISILQKNNILEWIIMDNAISADDYTIYEYGVRSLLRIKGYISIQEISYIIGVNQTTLMQPFNKTESEYDSNKIVFLKNTYVIKDIALEAIKKNIKNRLANEKDVNVIAELNIKLIDTPYKQTLHLAEKHLKNEINKLSGKSSEYKKDDFGRHINSIHTLFKILYKELSLYNDDEIADFLISDKLKPSHRVRLMIFFNFVRKTLGESCNYKKQVGESLIKQLTKDKNNGEKDEKYTEEVWFIYYEFLRDIDKHILRSFEDERYAQIWLFCLLHLSITWRYKDIVNKILNVSLEVVGIDNLEWFKLGNSFTLGMAIKLLECIQFSLDGIIAYKNKMNLHFNIPLSLKIPTAVALVINEIHRRNKNEKILLYTLYKKHPTKKGDFLDFFRENPELADFSNLKATKTLMTFNFATATNTMGRAGVAYVLGTYGRSHKTQGLKLSNTTYTYFHFTKEYGSPENVALQTMEMGMFGYLYMKILKLSLPKENFSILTQEEITTSIKMLKEHISPISVESLSGNILENKMNVYLSADINTTVDNLKKLPKNFKNEINEFLMTQLKQKYSEIATKLFPEQSKELSDYIDKRCKNVDSIIQRTVGSRKVAINILTDIKNGERNCYTYDSNCLFNELERREKCPNKSQDSCVSCIYNIMGIMELYEINSRLNNILDEMLFNTLLTDIDLMRYTLIMQNYFSCIVQAKAQFDGFDEEVLTAFIDLDSIRIKVHKLKNEGKLLYKKWEN
jgi:hypothetical protein